MTASGSAKERAETLRIEAFTIQASLLRKAPDLADAIGVSDHLLGVASAGGEFGHPDDRDLFESIIISWHDFASVLRTIGIVVPSLDPANADARRKLHVEDLAAEMETNSPDHDFVSIDLVVGTGDKSAGQLFESLDFSGRRFVDCSFTDARFGKGLQKAYFTRCGFHGCDFVNVRGSGSHFPDCLFQNVLFDGANFPESDFVRAIFEKDTRFRGRCDFRSSSFALSSFRSCRVGQSRQRSDFSEASFSRTTLVSCTFTNVIFEGATFDHTLFQQGPDEPRRVNSYVNCEFKNAAFVGVELALQDLSKSNLAEALFVRCSLEGHKLGKIAALDSASFIRCEGVEALSADDSAPIPTQAKK